MNTQGSSKVKWDNWEQSGQKQCQPQAKSIISRLYCLREGRVWQQGWLGNLATAQATGPVPNYSRSMVLSLVEGWSGLSWNPCHTC